MKLEQKEKREYKVYKEKLAKRVKRDTQVLKVNKASRVKQDLVVKLVYMVILEYKGKQVPKGFRVPQVLKV